MREPVSPSESIASFEQLSSLIASYLPHMLQTRRSLTNAHLRTDTQISRQLGAGIAPATLVLQEDSSSHRGTVGKAKQTKRFGLRHVSATDFFSSLVLFC